VERHPRQGQLGIDRKLRVGRRATNLSMASQQTATLFGVHFVYMLRCADGTLYTGYARDPHRRESIHNTGHGARYTAGRRPVHLVYVESFASRGEALRREWQLKRLRRPMKEALVATYLTTSDAAAGAVPEIGGRPASCGGVSWTKK
jgi:putative endonuclease